MAILRFVDLENFTYQPQPQKKFTPLEKAAGEDGGRKTFSIPVFSDRVVQEALLKVISPIFENGFVFDSYAFRRGKGTHSALERFDEFKRRASPRRFPNSGFILKADIKNYYPSISRSILISCLRKKILDERIIWLVKKFINLNSQDKGISMGNPLSQLFANIYLNEETFI